MQFTPLLFLKAITKKQVWIAGYVRKDGTRVDPHYATVNVQLDHDHEKVASGNGSGPQREAWKHLSKQEDHLKLSKEDQAHNIAHLATDIQNEKTNAAQVTFFKQAILDGKNPRPADFRAFQNAPRERKLSAAYAIIDAGKETEFDALIGDTNVGDWSVADGAVFEKQEDGSWKEIERRVKAKKVKPKSSKYVDPNHDDLLTAIAKLGGLSREDAEAQGIDPAHFGLRGYSFKRVFTKNGMSFDDAAHNFLGPDGYPAGSANELLESLSTALGGSKVYTPNGQMNAADAAHAEQYDAIPDDYLGDFDGSRYDAGEYGSDWTPPADVLFELGNEPADYDGQADNKLRGLHDSHGAVGQDSGLAEGPGGEGQSGSHSDDPADSGDSGEAQGQSGSGEGAEAAGLIDHDGEAGPVDGSRYTYDVNSVPMLHSTTQDAASSIKNAGFRPSSNSMYGKGVYFSSNNLSDGGYGDTALSVSLKPHKQLVLARDTDVPKAFQELTGLQLGYLGDDKGMQAMLDAGVGSMRFPVDDEVYTVVIDPGLIDLNGGQADASANYVGEANQFVLHGGDPDTERAALVDLGTGQVLGKKEGGKGAGNVDEIAWEKSGQQKVGLIHNHPDGGTLSISDIKQLFMQGYDEIAAVNQSGTGSFIARPVAGADWRSFKAVDTGDVDDLFLELGVGAFSSKDSLQYAREHCRLLALQHQGVIHYEVVGDDPVHQKALDELANGIEGADANVVQKFHDAIGGEFRKSFTNLYPDLLKATTKKQVWIPTFVKKDGTVIGGHYQFVHVTDNHTDAAVAGGGISHSQKKAHAKLSKEPGFNELPDPDKTALVMSVATVDQDGATFGSQVSMWRKKMLAGGKPTNAEWKSFLALPDSKSASILAEVMKAGHFDHYVQLLKLHVAKDETSEKPSETPEKPSGTHPAAQALIDGKSPTKEDILSFASLPKDEMMASLKPIVAASSDGSKKAKWLLNAADKLSQAEKQEKPNHTFSIKPHEGGFKIESNNGGGFVANKPAGAGLYGPAPKVFKTEAEAKAYLKKKGMELDVGDSDPKDGDTKPGADGTLVFKDGRWHKQGEDAPDLKPVGGLGLHIVKHPSGKYGFTGTVPNEVGYVSDATAEQIAAAKIAGEAFGPKKMVFDTLEQAQEHAESKGYKVNSTSGQAKDAPHKQSKETSTGIETGSVLTFDSQFEKMNHGQWKVYNQDADQYYLHKVGVNGKALKQNVALPKSTLDAAVAGGTAQLGGDVDPSSIPGIDGWYASLAAGKVPTKEQHEAVTLEGFPKHYDLAVAKYGAEKASALVKPSIDAVLKSSLDPDGQYVADLLSGKSTGHYAILAAKKLSADPAWLALPGPEQKVQVKALEKQLQAAASASAAVTGWKKSMLAGKVPTPSQIKAFSALPEAKQFSLLTTVSNALGSDKAHDLVNQAAQKAGLVSLVSDPQGSPKVGPPDVSNLVPDELNLPELDPHAEDGIISDLPGHEGKDYKKVGGVWKMRIDTEWDTVKASVAVKLDAYVSGKLKSAETLIDNWKHAVNLGFPPTKAQADAFEAMDEDEQMMTVMEISHDKVPASGVDDDPDGGDTWHDLVEAENDEIMKLHEMGLSGKGPKEGDTKVKDGVTYVLQDGRWHRVTPQEEASPAAPKAETRPARWELIDEGLLLSIAGYDKLLAVKDAEDVGQHFIAWGHGQYHVGYLDDAGIPSGYIKDFAGTDLAGLLNHLTSRGVLMPTTTELASLSGAKPAPKAQYDVFHYEFKSDKSNKFWAVHVEGNKLITQWGKIGTKGQSVTKELPSHEAALQAMNGLKHSKTAKGYELVSTSTAEQAAPANTSTASKPGKPSNHPSSKPTPKSALKAGKVSVKDASGWKKVGPQQGSNPGGVFKDAAGNDWYVKFPKSEDHAKNELLASKLYQAAGVDVPTLRLVQMDGKLGIASKMVPGVTQVGAGIKSADGALEGFAVDAWLGNYDAVGTGYDNLLRTSDGKAIRIDVGGSLLYRAQGAPKGDAFGNEVAEIEGMLDASKNHYAASVFAGISKQKLDESVALVIDMPDDVIAHLVDTFGPGAEKDKKALTAKLIARKADLAKKYPDADLIANPPKPDPRKLPINPSMLPDIPDFLNWKGPGQGLSSVDSVNQANQAAVKEIYDAAMKGDYVALKKIKYHVVNKDTGTVSAGESFGEHPSQHVRDFYSKVIDYMEVIANPASTKKKNWVVSDYSDIEDLSEGFPAHYYGVGVGDVPANQRLGFWISLGQSDISAFMPDNVHWTSAADHAAGKGSTNGMTTKLKAWMKAVKSSGSANQPFRDGKDTISIKDNVYKTREILEDAYEHMVEFEEGTNITKFIDFPPEMMKQMMGLEPGHVFQNPGSMCCSLNKDWSWHGGAKLNIIYGKGAKALYNIGVGSYNSEGEVTTVPGQRFMLLERKTQANGKPEFTLLMLPPDNDYIANIQPKS